MDLLCRKASRLAYIPPTSMYVSSVGYLRGWQCFSTVKYFVFEKSFGSFHSLFSRWNCAGSDVLRIPMLPYYCRFRYQLAGRLEKHDEGAGGATRHDDGPAGHVKGTKARAKPYGGR